MDLDFSEEQVMLRDTAKGLCEEHSPSAVVRAMEGDDIGYPQTFWQALSELGVVGLTIPEAYDGMNMGALETAIVYEEFGRKLAPTPHFVSAVLGAKMLELAGTAEQKSQWLPTIASGEKILTVATDEPQRGFSSKGVQLTATPTGDGFKLNGVKILVPYANSADGILISARQDSSILFFLVDPKANGVTITAEKNHASAALFQVKLDNVQVAKTACLGDGSCVWAIWDQAMLDSLIALAAQAIGGAEAIHAMTTDYAKQRVQFDKAIGSFQAIAHYLADAIVKIEGAKTLVYQAAWAKDNGKPYAKLAAQAKLQACNVFRENAVMGVQVHGGFGFTTEGDPQLYFRRSKLQQLMYWDTRYLEDRIADYLLED